MANLDFLEFDPLAVYSHDYFFGGDYINYLADRSAFDLHFRDRLQEITRYRSSGDLLEIGCAYGFFLATARECFHVRGFDIAQEPVTFARSQLGLDARCGDFTDTPYPAASADMIVMWDTIEHLAFPERMVAKVAAVLRDDGYLFLTTGDIDSALARLQREHWRMIHPPSHLQYFTRRSISQLLARNGLKTVRIQSVGVRRSLAQVLFGLLALGQNASPSLLRKLAASRVGHWSFVLNTYDIMLVVASKCSQR